MSQIYLDNNATTAMLPEVIETVTQCMEEGLANPASQHATGRLARKRLAAAKETIGRILGLRTGPQRDRIIITSGGTESNNSALRGLIGIKGELIISAVEHPSIIGTAEWLAQNGHVVRQLPVDRNGVILLDELANMITEQTQLVSVMLGNNETGVLQPIRETVAICHRSNVLVHTDAVQAVGKIDVNFEQLGVDAMTFTAHKFHGPRGVAALVLRDPVTFQPLLVGGAQQLGNRPGTESVALVCGMARALELYKQDSGRTDRLRGLRDGFERALAAELEDIVIHGANTDRLPHTSNISFPGWDRQALLMALDRAGMACSTGSACSSGSSEPSHVLLAMHCEEALVKSALRFSLGADSNEEEMRAATALILDVVLSQKTGKN